MPTFINGETLEKCPLCNNGHEFSIMADKSAKCPCGAVFYYRHPSRLQRHPPIVCIGHGVCSCPRKCGSGAAGTHDIIGVQRITCKKSSQNCYLAEIKVVWIDDYADGGLTLESRNA